MSELARIEAPGAILPSAGEVLQQIMKAGITADNVAAVREAMAIVKEERAERAKLDFIQAFARVRARTGRINASHANPAKDGTVRWWMASLPELQDAIEPICREEGLELRYTTRREGPTSSIVVGVCIVTHTASGHQETAEGSINAANAMGGDAGAATTACRVATIRMFALKVAHDDNSRILGDVANAEQVRELQGRLRATGGDERKFLAWALNRGAESIGPDTADAWKQIRQGRLETLHTWLHRKEMSAGATGRPSAGNVGGSTAGANAHAPATPTAPRPTPQPPAEATPESQTASTPTSPTGAPTEPTEAEKRAIVAAEWAASVVAGGNSMVNKALRSISPATLEAAKVACGLPGPVGNRPAAEIERILVACKMGEAK